MGFQNLFSILKNSCGHFCQAVWRTRSRVSSPDFSTHSVRLLFKASSLIEIARANPSLVRKLTMNLPESFPVSASPFGISSLANALRILEAVLTVLTAAPACVRHQSSIAEVAVERSVSPARLSANIVADFLTAMCKERVRCTKQKIFKFSKKKKASRSDLSTGTKSGFSNTHFRRRRGRNPAQRNTRWSPAQTAARVQEWRKVLSSHSDARDFE